ncbi:unnamed protein product [Arabidopsis arenosa]|uniref:Uncharacterized protein n=1 Tax=Arabidopsis arenosa TaxID=38785 RepID=A0A8S2AV02_ARAAE|nr:unnamed protein product [Arabidopsis arenosa]
MANRQMEIETGFPTPLSSATDPPPPSRWWTQLYSLFLRRNELTQEEKSAIFLKPYLCGALTFFAVMTIFLYIDKLFCHVNFSVQSISVSPSCYATWHVDFLVNPSSWCPINCSGDDVYAKLGSLNAAVLKTSRKRGSRGGHTSFSVDLATEGNQRVFINTLLNVQGKTKDNIKSRLDLQEHCNRKELHLTPDGKAPIPIFRLKHDAKEVFLRWLQKDVKFSDGYSSSLANCVDLPGKKLTGMKSHDCHVLMQRLFPIAFAELMDKSVHDALSSKFSTFV